MDNLDLNPSFLKRVSFIWIIPIINYYKQNKPSPSNLLPVSHQEDYETSTNLLKFNFQEQCRQGVPSFTRAFMKTFSRLVVALIKAKTSMRYFKLKRVENILLFNLRNTGSYIIIPNTFELNSIGFIFIPTDLSKI